MTDAQALWFDGNQQFSLRAEPLAALEDGWCQFEALYSAISPGTERLVYSGKVPESLYQEMRCLYMGGDFPFPLKYGYSLVGKIVEGPREWIDTLVHVLHPHQDRGMVQIKDLYPVPAAVSPQQATLASNLETAINAIWDAQVSIGDRVLIVGFGIVGSLIARLLSFMPGVQVEILDVDSAKMALIEKMGFCQASSDENALPFDLAFHASGTAAGLQTAIDGVGFEGRIIDLSWYGIQAVTLQLGGSFHPMRKTIISSQVSHISPSQRPRWDHRRRKALVFSLLERSEFASHITQSVPFAELPGVLSQLLQAPSQGLSYLVEYYHQSKRNDV